MNKKIKILILIVSIFLCGAIRVNAALQCSSGWSVVTYNNKNYCCPSGWGIAHFSDGKTSCYLDSYAISKKDCEAMGGSHAAIYTECTITPQTPTMGVSTYTMTFYRNDSTKNLAEWTSTGSGFQREGTVQASCNSSPCVIQAGPTIKRNHYSFRGWSTSSGCSTLASQLRFPVTINENKTLYACWNQVSACYVCGSAGYGKYVYGNMAEASQCNFYSNESKTICESHNAAPTEQQKPDDFTSIENGTSGGTSGGTNDGTTETATIINYYKITYNLEGGHYIDGSTSRTQIVRGDKPVGDFLTNPVKEDYTFTEWQYNDSSFDFSKKLDDVASSVTVDSAGFRNITLKAVYAEYGDADLVYCEDEKAELDLKTKKCYTTLEENADAKTYTHTTYTYSANSRWCYAYKAAEGTTPEQLGGINFIDGVKATAEGKDNKTDGVYAGYSKDSWVSINTCKIASPCKQDSTWREPNSCEIRWDAILYKAVDAKTKEKEYGEDDSFSSNTDTDKDVPDSPKTGDALILIAWTVGIGALGYTVYYFRKRKEN